jgi:hypothetical protein
MYRRIEPRIEPPSNPAHIGSRSLQVLIGRKQERHVDGNPVEDRVFNRGEPLVGAWNFDE